MKNYFLILLAVIFTAAACDVQQKITVKDNSTQVNQTTPPSIEQPKTNTQTRQGSGDSDHMPAIVYDNSEYGFQLTLTSAWKGYRVTKKPQVGVTNSYRLEFGFPTSDKNYGDGSGYSVPMVIIAYAKPISPNVEEEISQHEGYAGENPEYVFAYGQWQDPPMDLIKVNFEVPRVISSFKLTRPSSQNSGIKATITARTCLPHQDPCYVGPAKSLEVSVRNTEETIVKNTVTDEKGKFQVDLPAGHYIVQFPKTNFDIGKEFLIDVTSGVYTESELEVGHLYP